MYFAIRSHHCSSSLSLPSSFSPFISCFVNTSLSISPWKAVHSPIHGDFFYSRYHSENSMNVSSEVILSTFVPYYTLLAFPGGVRGKEPTHQCRKHKRCGFDPWVRKIPWKRAWQPTLVFLPGESHGQEPGGLQSLGSHRVKHDWSY